LAVGVAVALGGPEEFIAGLGHAAGRAQLGLAVHQVLDVLEEPGVDVGQRVDRVEGHPGEEGVADRPDPVAVGGRQGGADLVLAGASIVVPGVLAVAAEAEAAHFEAAERLLERFAEGPADRHDLADRLHLGGQGGVGVGELLEGEAGDLRDDVVDRRLEAGGRLAW
jgi:hypothetical protein